MEIGQIIQSKFANSRQKAIVNLRYTSNYFNLLQNKYMSKFDLTMPQFNILRILRGAKGVISVNAVKDRMIERSPNTTRLMDKLIEKELIERVRCEEDRRIVYVSITDGGLELLAKIDNEHIGFIDLSENLSEQEAESLSNLLDKMRG